MTMKIIVLAIVFTACAPQWVAGAGPEKQLKQAPVCAGVDKATCEEKNKVQGNEEASLLQVNIGAHSQANANDDEEEQEDASYPDEVHCVFIVDCRPFNLWQAELLFFSAARVGQMGPITEIVSGCSKDKKKEVMQRHNTLRWPKHFQIHFVPRFNDKKSIWLSKPYGFKSWYHDVGPEREVVAVLDPDFVFLRPLTAELDGGSTALAWEGEVPKRVQKGVVAAQRYSLIYPDGQQGLWHLPLKAKGMDNAALLTYVCSGSATGISSCTNLTNHEMGFYQSTGVPYIAHRNDWDWLVDSWENITVRLHEHADDGFLVDMYSWILANVHHGQRQLVLHNFMLTAVEPPQSRYETWEAVDALEIDACSNPLEEVLANQTAIGLPHFIHYCAPQDTFNKYWFDWAVEGGAHVFERCDDGNSSAGLKNIMLETPVRTQEEILIDKEVRFSTLEGQHRSRFMGCTMRSLFKEALRRSCDGHPSAVFVTEKP